MSKIIWRERFIAAAIHFFFTALVSGLAAVLIFRVWFPDGLASLIGGGTLFLIMTACDVVLGPMLSLVIYSSAKSKRALIIDYTIIGLLQLAALGYGVWTMSVSRPLFVAFDVRRIEIVTALELDDAELAQGVEPRFRERSLGGPTLVSMQRPENVKERSDLVLAEFNGRGAYLSPKYYRDYETQLDEIRQNERSIDELIERNPAKEGEIRKAIEAAGKSASDLRWMHAHHRFGFGVALFDATTHRPIRFVPIDAD